MTDKSLRKFKFERQVGRVVVNSLVAALDRIGIRSSLVVEVETTVARSGQPPGFGGGGKVAGSATAVAMRALQSDPISVRITFTD
jgi:hypothetical protein